ncbi:MAG: putative Zn-dependent protease [Candidatus Endobugula sp.]|jgi:predicted Zn-dependent protease
MRITFVGLTLCMAILSGCGTNPVTGKNQVTLMSQDQEIALGKQQYSPSQQSQGGAYLVDNRVNAYVNRIGQSLAKHSAQPNLPYDFVVLNNDVPNAWALPGGKIALNRGLLVLLEDEAQLAAVLGHEIVHAAARHSAEHAATSTGIQILTAILQTQTDNNLYRQGAALGGGAVQAHYGRENELESDYYGINYMVAEGYDPHGAVELQQIFLRLSQDRGKASWLDPLFASHPPSAERVRKNQARANQLPKGKRNKAAFQTAISRILKDKPAYKLHQDALATARKEDWNKALSLTNQAIKKQSKEARFHITRGRLLDQKDNNKMAIKAFDQAIKLEPNYFSGWLYRGLTHQKIKLHTSAEKDFLASNQLLETQTANYNLGEIALQKNQRQLAINYYRRAAKGGGEVAKAAAGKLKKLDTK